MASALLERTIDTTEDRTEDLSMTEEIPAAATVLKTKTGQKSRCAAAKATPGLSGLESHLSAVGFDAKKDTPDYEHASTIFRSSLTLRERDGTFLRLFRRNKH
jgi:hypothetical protein